MTVYCPRCGKSGSNDPLFPWSFACVSLDCLTVWREGLEVQRLRYLLPRLLDKPRMWSARGLSSLMCAKRELEASRGR